MKTLNITFTDEEYKKLLKAKKKNKCSSWHLFILRLSKGESVKRNGNGKKTSTKGINVYRSRYA